MKTEKHICDISGCGAMAPFVQMPLQVIFHTEQTEGRSCPPYLYNTNLDLCEAHKARILQGNYVHADGAQGHNNYYFQ